MRADLAGGLVVERGFDESGWAGRNDCRKLGVHVQNNLLVSHAKLHEMSFIVKRTERTHQNMRTTASEGSKSKD